MDPCPFIRLTIGNLALKVPLAAKTTSSVVHPSSSPCFCKIKLKNFPPQTAAIPYIPLETTQFPEIQTLAATFHLSSSDIERLASRSIFASKPCLKILIYTGRAGAACGVHSGRLLAKVSVPLDLAGTQSKSCVFHNGWLSVGKGAGKSSTSAQFHLNVKAEPDPRFVFQFDGEPECSPQVVQIQGNIRQPVFTCKFSFRHTGDRTQRSRSVFTAIQSNQIKSIFTLILGNWVSVLKKEFLIMLFSRGIKSEYALIRSNVKDYFVILKSHSLVLIFALLRIH